MSNARNISKAESRFVNATGDTMSGDIVTTGSVGVGVSGTPYQKLQVDGNIYLGPNDVSAAIHAGGNITLSSDGTVYIVSDSNDSSSTVVDGIVFGGGSYTDTHSNEDFTADEYSNGGTDYPPRFEFGRFDGAGRLLLPNQPAFSANLPADSIMTGTVYMPFTDVKHNVGNALNNGAFTAPVTGTYFITASLSYANGKLSSDDTAYYGIDKNGSYYAQCLYNPIYFSGSGVENVASISAVVPLAAGDVVRIKHSGVSQTPSPYFVAEFCTFSGYLIG